MTEATFDDVVDLTDRLYEAAYDDTAWPHVMVKLRSMFNGSRGAFGFYDHVDNTQLMLYGDCDIKYERSWADPTLENPYLPGMLPAAAGHVFNEHSMMSASEFERTVFYNEWMLPQGETTSLVGKTVNHGSLGAYLIMQRSVGQPAFDDGDIKLMHRLMPTMMRTTALRRRVASGRLTQKALAYGAVNIGFLVVNEAGRVLEANAVAQEMLGGNHNGLTLMGDRLVMIEPRRRDMFRQLILDACGGGGLDPRPSAGFEMAVVSAASGLPSLAVTVAPFPDASSHGLPVRRAAFVFLQELTAHLPPRFEERMRALFGFTRKEAALAAALVKGQSLREASEERFVSLSTTRTQLAQIFRKTGTRQQSQLVSLLLGILPVHPGL
ncbi:MAG TPA: helix-turn-helix transcriptional regulator [Devosiaceae bacterium]|jgi:DNA-binding CsgD family transcriptional regulator/PAS domain-containing protein